MPEPTLNGTAPVPSGHTYPFVNIQDNASVQLGNVHYKIEIQDSILWSRQSSTGFNNDEINNVARLAWKLYKACRSMPDSFRSISSDLSSLRALLEECEEVFPDVSQPGKRVQRLQTITRGCQETLQHLDAIVQDFQGRDLRDKQTWEAIRWREYELNEIRLRVFTHVSILTAFISTSQCRVEQKLDALLRVYKAGHKEGSVISSLSTRSLTSNQASRWREVRKELERHNITVEMLHAKKDFIVDWFDEAFVSGAFEESQTHPDTPLLNTSSSAAMQGGGSGTAQKSPFSMSQNPKPLASRLLTLLSSSNDDEMACSQNSKPLESRLLTLLSSSNDDEHTIDQVELRILDATDLPTGPHETVFIQLS